MAYGIFLCEEDVMLAMSLQALIEQYNRSVKVFFSKFSCELDLGGQLWECGIISIDPKICNDDLLKITQWIFENFQLNCLLIMTTYQVDINIEKVSIIDKGAELFELVEEFLEKLYDA